MLRLAARDVDGTGDAFALGANDLGEVYAAGILDEDVEGCGNGDDGQREMRLTCAAVESADEFPVYINLRVVVHGLIGFSRRRPS